jgi:hypothetical protein
MTKFGRRKINEDYVMYENEDKILFCGVFNDEQSLFKFN